MIDCPACGKKHRTQHRVELCPGYAKWNERYATWRSSLKATPFCPDGSREKEPYPDELLSFPGFTNQIRDYYWPVIAKVIEQRDESTCQDCGTKVACFEVHHIIPRGLGGSHHPANLKLVCKHCHSKYNEQFNGEIISKKAQEKRIRRLQRQNKTLDGSSAR
jgi:hypothetical protein